MTWAQLSLTLNTGPDLSHRKPISLEQIFHITYQGSWGQAWKNTYFIPEGRRHISLRHHVFVLKYKNHGRFQSTQIFNINRKDFQGHL